MKLDNIIRGDVLTTLAEIPNASIDLIITSPPYNIALSLKKHKDDSKNSNWTPALGNGFDGYIDDMAPDTYVKWQRDIIRECLRVLKQTGALFYNHKKMIRGGLLQTHDKILSGFPVRQDIIWDKGSGNNFERSFLTPSHENVYLICNPDFKFKKGSVLRDVLQIGRELKNKHPAPFPVELPLQLINVTNAKVILDPFMGSGSTAVAAVRAGRHYIGIEQSPKYIQQAMTRIKNTRPDNTQRRLL